MTFIPSLLGVTPYKTCTEGVRNQRLHFPFHRRHEGGCNQGGSSYCPSTSSEGTGSLGIVTAKLL